MNSRKTERGAGQRVAVSAVRAAPFALSSLNARERNAFVACVGGWALDGMDFQMYPLVIPTLIAAWGITRGQAGALGTAALLSSAVGGWLAGWCADRYGRVRTLQVAVGSPGTELEFAL